MPTGPDSKAVADGRHGYSVGDDAALHVLFGPGTPLAAVALWALFAASGARLWPAVPLSHQGLKVPVWLSRRHAHSASANDTPTNTAPRPATTLATTLATA